MAIESQGEKTKTKKQYKRHECPYCHKVKGNLPNHILQKHPTEAAAPGLDKAVLTGAAPPARIELTTSHTQDNIYYCIGCHAELRKGEDSCWQCGQGLDWTNIE